MLTKDWVKLIFFIIITFWVLNTIPYPSIYCDRLKDTCSVYEKATFALIRDHVYSFRISEITGYKIKNIKNSGSKGCYYYIPVLYINGEEKELYGFNFRNRNRAEDFIFKIQNYDTYKLKGNILKLFFNMY